MSGAASQSADSIFAVSDCTARLCAEEVEVVAQVSRMVRERIAPRAAHYDETREFPWDNVRLLNELGLNSMFIPEANGGTPLSLAAYLMCLREVSRGCASTGLTWATNFHATAPIVEFASPLLKNRYLPRIAAGGLAAIAITEASGGSDATLMRTTFVPDGDDVLISGEKVYVTNGDVADFILVFGKWAELGSGRNALSAAVVERSAPGVSVLRRENKLGHRASTTVTLGFADVRMSLADLVGAPGHGLEILTKGLHRSRLSFAAHTIGIARAALDDLLECGATRVVGGRVLLAHQGNQFELANLGGELLLCESLLWSLACLEDPPVGAFGVLAGILKLRAADAAVRIADFALQLRGGAGYCREFQTERLWRDARLAPVGEGAREWIATIVGRHLAGVGRG